MWPMFSGNKEIKELIKISNELSDIGSAAGLMAWDQETYMPPKGAGVRAHALATVSGIYHEKLTKTPKSMFKTKSKNIYDQALVRELRREYEKAVKLPKKLVEEISEATSVAFEAWRGAKEKSDFPKFAPKLAKLLDLKIQ